MVNQDPNEPLEPITNVPAEPLGSPQRSRKRLLLVIVAALLVLGGGVLWYVQSKNAATNEASKTKETKDIELLRIASGEGPANVVFPDETLSSLQNILDHQIYEGLVGFEGTKIVPLIAQSWTNPDQKTWIFKIRPNIMFHTGNKVTAKEVKASLDRLSKYDYWSIFTSTIASTEATGDLELTIKTKEPDALLLNRLIQAYITDLSVSDKMGNDGTGAYQIDKSAKYDEQHITLMAFDDYYRGHVKTRKVQFTVYDNDDQMIAAIKNNEADIVQTLPFPEVKKQLDELGLANHIEEAPGTYGLYMNQISGNPIVKNKDFRTALALAMDRESLVDQTGKKNTPSYQVIPKILPGHDASLGFPKFDLTAAKASLAKSGYKNQQLVFVTVNEIQTDPAILIKQLEALGVNIKVKNYSAKDTDKAIAEVNAGRYDLFTAGFTSDISDARDLLGALVSTKESTYPTYNNAEYDKLLTDSDKAFDPTERIKLLQQANKHIQDNVAWIPLRNAIYMFNYPKDIDIKVDFNGSGNVGAYFWKVGRFTD